MFWITKTHFAIRNIGIIHSLSLTIIIKVRFGKATTYKLAKGFHNTHCIFYRLQLLITFLLEGSLMSNIGK